MFTLPRPSTDIALQRTAWYKLIQSGSFA